jgi:hypothetical protein
MARFYCLEVAQDLFGRVVLVRRWGPAWHLWPLAP